MLTWHLFRQKLKFQFFGYIIKFSPLICWLRSETVVFTCSQTVPLKNIHIHNLSLLNFVFIVVFDVEAVPENTKLAILERLESQSYFARFSTMVGVDQEIGNFLEENFVWFYKNRDFIYVKERVPLEMGGSFAKQNIVLYCLSQSFKCWRMFWVWCFF